MRPIDVIRTKMDPDLKKYQQTTLCEIVDQRALKDVPGIGLVAWVRPLDSYDVSKDKTLQDSDGSFPVHIINSWFTSGWVKLTFLKYRVLVTNAGLDSPGLASGVLIPSSQVQVKQSEFYSLGKSIKKELISDNK